jgi:putative membrane protein
MKRFLISSVITAVGLWVVDLILPAISLTPYGGTTLWHAIASYALVAVIFSIVSAVVTPIIKIIAFPIYLLTFGLISIVINGAMFLFVAWLSAQFADSNLTVQGFSEGLYVESLGWAMLASLMLSIFSVIGRTITRTKR